MEIEKLLRDYIHQTYFHSSYAMLFILCAVFIQWTLNKRFFVAYQIFYE